MLERDDRRQRRHVGRAPQDLGAVDDVHAHDRELVVGELVGLVQDLDRRAHLADVVHQRGEAELAQQRPFDAQRARLRHRQDRHVHHVREGVVVVFLERGQRDQRGAVLRDRLREVVDELAGLVRIGLPFVLRGVPQRAGDVDGVGVEPANRRDVGRGGVDALVEADAADADVRQRLQRGRWIGGQQRRRRCRPACARDGRASAPAC